MRLAAQAKGGFYPTPPRVLDLLATLLRPPARRPAGPPGITVPSACSTPVVGPGPPWPS